MPRAKQPRPKKTYELAIGPDVIEALATAYQADSPVWLDGPPGIGKSEIVEQAAELLGIAFKPVSLAPMERSDWEGMPHATDERTVFLRPEFLPEDGAGLLALEEMNRAGDDVLAPLHELLTRRAINAHVLPPAWLPIAITNPENSEFALAKLGDALQSRFVHLHVRASLPNWLEYAVKNHVHPDVIAYAQTDRSIFDTHPLSNPRSWTAVSKILYAAEQRKTPQKIVRRMIEGKVTPARVAAFFRFLRAGNTQPLEAPAVLNAYAKHQHSVMQWVSARIDLVDHTLGNLRMHLQLAKNVTALQGSPRKQNNLRRFLSDIPGDLAEQMVDWLSEKKGYRFPL